MKAIIPAAGYGTRLRPLTYYIPKALIDIAGRPVIEHILDKIVELGCIDSVYIISNNYYYDVFAKWLKGISINSNYPFHIEIINDGTNNEQERLGAIGDKLLAIRQNGLECELLDISSDNIFDFSLLPIYDLYKKKKSCVLGAYDVGSIELAKKYGVLAVDKNWKIIEFQEKPPEPKSTLASTGIYFYTKKIVKLFEEYANAGHCLDAPGTFIQWLHKKEDSYAYNCKGKWFDIGSMESLEIARREMKCVP
ncbi:MAG: nucleotidyltransferase family protein [Candidatus Diapherotrites archaeon]|nr:nucleotidyltransferase family protein [Candidatus Diapherotrites archaeon]